MSEGKYCSSIGGLGLGSVVELGVDEFLEAVVESGLKDMTSTPFLFYSDFRMYLDKDY